MAGQTYTDQRMQSNLVKEHTWSAWSSDGIESHSHTCIACGASASDAHNWEDQQCTDCAHADISDSVSESVVTVSVASLAEGCQILAAGYTSDGQMTVCSIAQYGTSAFETLELSKSADTAEVHIFILDANWSPIRACLIF